MSCSIVYESAHTTSDLNLLNPLADQALRLCLGAFRTSPANSLQILAHEPLLHLCKTQISIQYCTKLRSNPTNPTYQFVFPRQSNSVFITKHNLIPPISIRLCDYLAAISMFKTRVTNSTFSPITPWLLQPLTVNLDLVQTTNKQNSPPEQYISCFK